MAIRRFHKGRVIGTRGVKVSRIKVENIHEGGRKMEVVVTRQGSQVVDTEKCAKAINEIDRLIGSSYKTREECADAEQNFREYLLKKGYTRF